MNPGHHRGRIFSGGVILALTLGLLAPVTGFADDARLPGPRFPDVVKLWRDGDPAAALQLLDRVEQALAGGESPVDLLVLKATLLRAGKRYEESEAYWNGAVLREPALLDMALRALYPLRLARNDLEGAEACLEGRTGVAVEYADLAARHERAGDRAQAERLMRRALDAGLSGREADHVRLSLAALVCARGNVGEALRLLEKVRRTASEVRLARLALAQGTVLGWPIGLVPEKLGEDEYLAHTLNLRGRAEYREALRLLDEWKAAWPQSTRADEIEAEAIEILFRLRASDEGLSRCLAFAERYPGSDWLASVRFSELLFRQRFGQTEEMIALGERFWKKGEWGSAGMRRSAAMTVAAHLVSHGRVTAGLDLYRDIYRSGVDDAAARDILWRVGIASLANGQLDRAADNFYALLKRRPVGDTLTSALYWLAMSERQRGNNEESARLLLRLREEFTFNYYGMRAGESLDMVLALLDAEDLARLQAQPALPLPIFPDMTLPAASKAAPDYVAALTFARAGMAREAAEAAGRLLSARRNDKAVVLLAARAWDACGEHGRALRIVSDHFPTFVSRAGEGVPDDLLRLVYPRPWWDDVQAASAGRDVDPRLMMSLMRRESRFNRHARSWVGAIGLFQIMPYTARELSPRIGLGAVNNADLYDPRINATIAAALAADLLARFDHRIAPMVASYNAGEDRVAAWWRSTPDSALHEALFVDTIPYRETRLFVREVLTNYYMYRALYPEATGQASKDAGEANQVSP